MHSPQTPNNYIGIENPDTPIFRIERLPRLLEAMEKKKASLITPDLWPDKYELLPHRCKIAKRKPQYQATMSHLYTLPAYAQCWSATEESETLLRAYSQVDVDKGSLRNTCPEKEGVTIRSTPRKLLESLMAWVPPTGKNNCFIGRVRYLNDTGIFQCLADGFGPDLPSQVISKRQMAEFLLLKRNAFNHENEVRLIYVGTRGDSAPKVINWSIEPNELFDSIMVDPRLAVIETKEREQDFRRLGFKGEFKRSYLYDPVGLEILLD